MSDSDVSPGDDALMARIAASADAYDDASVAAAADGERALRLLVERWERRIVGFAFRCLGDADEARDVAQETFVRAWQAARAHRYQGRGRFDAWLLRIAGNQCRGRLRRRRLLRWLPLSRTSGALEVAAPGADQPDHAAREAQAHAALAAALAQLPDRQRMAVVLKRFEGLSYNEIAQVLGCTPAAVESLLIRANQDLRERLRRAGLLD